MWLQETLIPHVRIWKFLSICTTGRLYSLSAWYSLVSEGIAYNTYRCLLVHPIVIFSFAPLALRDLPPHFISTSSPLYFAELRTFMLSNSADKAICRPLFVISSSVITFAYAIILISRDSNKSLIYFGNNWCFLQCHTNQFLTLSRVSKSWEIEQIESASGALLSSLSKSASLHRTT